MGENINEKQIVVFKLADEEFGVDISEVKEIIKIEKVTPVPNTPVYVNGIINLRGDIVVVVDLEKKLGLPTKEADKDSRIIIIEMENKDTLGMVVDSATEVLRIPVDKLQPAPEVIAEKIDSKHLEGVAVLSDERLIILLDLRKVIAESDLDEFKQIKEEHAGLAPDPHEIAESSNPTESKDETTADEEEAVQQAEETSEDKMKEDSTSSGEETAVNEENNESQETSAVQETQNEAAESMPETAETKPEDSASEEPAKEEQQAESNEATPQTEEQENDEKIDSNEESGAQPETQTQESVETQSGNEQPSSEPQEEKKESE